MSAHHVELPEQVVTPGEELWVKIIDLDLERRRISLSIKQAAEGGAVAAEYQEHFGEHAYDEEGNFIVPESEGQEAWEAYYAEGSTDESEPVAEETSDMEGSTDESEPVAEEASTDEAELVAEEVTDTEESADEEESEEEPEGA